MSFSALDMREYIPELRRVAKLAELDGDEWDLDEVPPNSLELAAMCNPRRILALLDLLESYRDRVSALEYAATQLLVEVRRYRSRCTITSPDVEAAGVTYAQAVAWADAHDMEPCDPEFDTRDQPGDYAMMRMRRRGEGPECDAVFELIDGVSDRSVAYSCNTLGKAFGKPAFAILDEMAALPTKAQP